MMDTAMQSFVVAMKNQNCTESRLDTMTAVMNGRIRMSRSTPTLNSHCAFIESWYQYYKTLKADSPTPKQYGERLAMSRKKKKKRRRGSDAGSE